MTRPDQRAAMQRIAEGHAEPRDHTRQARIASAYQPNPMMERYLSWQRSDPARFDRLPASAHTAVGYYASAKLAAEQLGIDTTTGSDT